MNFILPAIVFTCILYLFSFRELWLFIFLSWIMIDVMLRAELYSVIYQCGLLLRWLAKGLIISDVIYIYIYIYIVSNCSSNLLNALRFIAIMPCYRQGFYDCFYCRCHNVVSDIPSLCVNLDFTLLDDCITLSFQSICCMKRHSSWWIPA